jgi:threonine dehydratase
MINLKDIKEARKRIEKVIYKTPFAYAPILSQKVGNEIFFKKRESSNNRSF